MENTHEIQAEPATYTVALADCNGHWEVLERFLASGDIEASNYAEANYPDLEWYVLNARGENING